MAVIKSMYGPGGEAKMPYNVISVQAAQRRERADPRLMGDPPD